MTQVSFGTQELCAPLGGFFSQTVGIVGKARWQTDSVPNDSRSKTAMTSCNSLHDNWRILCKPKNILSHLSLVILPYKDVSVSEPLPFHFESHNDRLEQPQWNSGFHHFCKCHGCEQKLTWNLSVDSHNDCSFSVCICRISYTYERTNRGRVVFLSSL